MSGPTTAIFTGDPVTVLVSAAAIRAAQAVMAGYSEAADIQATHQQNRDRMLAAQKSANQQGLSAMQANVKNAEAEFARIAELAKRYGAADKIAASLPARPDTNSESQMATYVQALRSLVHELRSILLTESALRMDDADPGLILQSVIDASAPPAQLDAVQRLLSRIAHLGEYPQQIAAIAQDITAQPTLETERAKLLMNELRLRIQQHAEAIHNQHVQEATSLVLEQSLKDLGYQVEAVSHTLFVEGGVVHFRKPGWDNYMVRMRMDPKNASTNFNVIRAVEAESNERSVQDHIAEDRWCAEFPALLKALEARGLHLDVTRRLEAGEVPVQLVHKDKLPKFADTEEAQALKQQKSMKLS